MGHTLLVSCSTLSAAYVGSSARAYLTWCLMLASVCLGKLGAVCSGSDWLARPGGLRPLRALLLLQNVDMNSVLDQLMR